jgi:hypothetical protein
MKITHKIGVRTFWVVGFPSLAVYFGYSHKGGIMRYLMIGIMAAVLGGCLTGGEDKSSEPKVVGYARTTERVHEMPACSSDLIGVSNEMLAKTHGYAVATAPTEAASFCIYLEGVSPESHLYKGLRTQGHPLLDAGGQCLTVEQPQKDTITTSAGNKVVVDVIQEPCVRFYYAKDLKKE